MITCYNPFSLEGKRILVTGASSGIGRAIAIECSKMGANLIISGRNENRLLATRNELEGSDHHFFVADLTVESELNLLIDNLPKLDGIVFCSGISLLAPIKFCTREKFDEIFNTNFFSIAELSRLIYKKKKINKGGSIVVISSIAGNRLNTSFGNSIYGASKSALASWMKYFARELANSNIRVNCILPGMIQTPMINPSMVTQEQLELDMQKYPLKRYGSPQEVAFSAIYLLSDTTQWITGAQIVIDGGISM